ncbi:hypothetical protein Tco_1165024 [Tanacetum coccineum]
MESLASNSQERERVASVATNARQSKGKLHGIFSTTSFTSPEKYFAEYTGIEVEQFRETLLQHIGNVKKSVAKRTRHKRQYDIRVNKRQMQTHASKNTSSSSGNYLTHVVDADIRPVNDQMPFAECENTKFVKPSILGKPILQPLRTQSVVRQPTAFRTERPKFSKPRFASQVDVKNDLPKPVTPHYLPKVRESVLVKPHHVITSGSSRNSSNESYGSNDMAHKYYLEVAKKKTQDKNTNLKPSVMHTTSLQNTTNGSKPKPRSNNQTSKSLLVPKSSRGMLNGVTLVDHSRNSSSFSDSKHFVCSTCQKCVFNANHDDCITKFLKEVNSHAKVQSPKSRNNIKPAKRMPNVNKPERRISKGYRFSPNKSSAVHEKPNTPRSCLRWKPTGRIFKFAGLRWIPTGKMFTDSITKVDSEPSNGSNDDIINPYECDQTLNISSGTLNLSADNTSGPALQRKEKCTIQYALSSKEEKSSIYSSSLLNAVCKKALNLLKKGLLIQGEAVEASKKEETCLTININNFPKVQVKDLSQGYREPDLVMSDSKDSTVTYMGVSSPFEDLSNIRSLEVDGLPMMPEDPYAYVVAAFQAPPSLDYVHGPEEPEQAPPSTEFVPEPIYLDLPRRIGTTLEYPVDGGDDDDDDDELSDDDEYDDDDDVEEDEDEEEEEEHPALADSVPSPVHRVTGRMSIRDQPPTPFWFEAEIDRLLTIPSPPPLLLSLLSSPLPQILSPPLLVSSPIHVSPPPLPASPIYPLGYRAAMTRLRAKSPSISHPIPLPSPIIILHTRAYVAMMRGTASSTYILASLSKAPPSGTPPLLPIPLPTPSPPLLLPSTVCRVGVSEVTLPPQNRLCIALDLRYEVVRVHLIPLLDPLEVLEQTMDLLLLWMMRFGETLRDMLVMGLQILGMRWLRTCRRHQQRLILAGLSQRMIDFVTTIRQDTYEIYVRLDDAQDDRSLMSGRLNMLYRDRRTHTRTALLIEREARLSHEAWVQSMDASDIARSKVRALRTTVIAQQAEIGDLRAADRTRQAQLMETLTLMSTL